MINTRTCGFISMHVHNIIQDYMHIIMYMHVSDYTI